MSKKNILKGFYYPDYIIENNASLSNFCLYFDEIHLAPTIAFKFSQPDSAAGKPGIFTFPFDPNNGQEGMNVFPFKDYLEEELSPFEIKNELLLNKVLYRKFPSEFMEYIRNNDSIEQLNKYLDNRSDYRNGDIRHQLKAIITSLMTFWHFSNNSIPISDDFETPCPISSNYLKSSAKSLSSFLAQECLELVLPSCVAATPEDILEAREKLKDELLPFRMSMCKLAFTFRKELLDNNVAYNDIKQEGKFFVETNVEPALYELRRKVNLEKGKFWSRIFGKILGWTSLIGQTFIAPSPKLIFDAIKRASTDTDDLLLSAKDLNESLQTGLIFLLKAEKVLTVK